MWPGGNVVGEAAYGVFNPVTLANTAVISLFDNLSLAGFTVMVEFLAFLAMGAYLLAREYGAGRVPAVVVAIAIPVSGFTLWYEASGRPAGLMGLHVGHPLLVVGATTPTQAPISTRWPSLAYRRCTRSSTPMAPSTITMPSAA